MKLEILTIVLDGMPFLPMQLNCFNRLQCDWRWNIVEGSAANSGSTAWCKAQQPRLSRDGSTQFITNLNGHPRVRAYQQQWWAGGKDQMVNTPLLDIKGPCWLLEIDVDELWQPQQIDKLAALVTGPIGNTHNCARFFCRYFLGPNIVANGRNCYGNRVSEWTRFWKFYPGMRFKRHEPPEMIGINDASYDERTGVVDNESCLSREETRALGLVFDHWAYVFPQQVAYKEAFYGYQGALQSWQRLQQNKVWPVKNLQSFLPWVGPGASADLLYR